jgi:hypothetical protein
MMKSAFVGLTAFIFIFLGGVSYAEAPAESNKLSYDSNKVLHPEWYIKVSDWSYYTAARVAILSSVTIENTADVPYKDVRVKLIYTSYSHPNAGIIATTTGMLPITLPPKSKSTYLKSGLTMGAGNQDYDVSDIQVISATPIKN